MSSVLVLLAILCVAVATKASPAGNVSEPDHGVIRSYEADCGRRDGREFEVNGEKVKSDQPWLVAVYYRFNSSIEWEYLTTGTLITPTHVVTNAWSVTIDNSNEAVPTTRLQLYAGKHLQDYNQTEGNSQMRGVKSVIIHEQFDQTKHIYSIGLLVAEQDFLLSWDVNVACVDWSHQLQAPTSTQVIITAGVSKGLGTSSRVFATQPSVMVPHINCTATAGKEERSWLSDEDLCAKTSGSDICQEVAGAGLLVSYSTNDIARFYLLAVKHGWLNFTSTGECYINMFSSYTDVSLYTTWLRQHTTST